MSQSQYALSFVSRGWAVLPLKHPEWDTTEPGKKGKSPDGDLVPHGLKNATKEIEKVKNWFNNGRPHNIGIVTGEISDLLVLDIDGSEGDAWMRSMIACDREFPPTLTVRTGKGHHRYFRHVKGIRGSAGKVHPQVDIRAEGGYIIGPGSVHENGTVYTIIDDSPVAACPAWLESLLRQVEKTRNATPEPTSEKNIATIPEGTRNTALMRLGCSLRSKGLDYPAINAALQSHNQSHCSRPMPTTEVAAIAKSASRYPQNKDDRLLCQTHPWTDAGAGEMFAAVHGDRFRHAKGMGWLAYDGQRFNSKRGEKEARLAVVNVARRLRDEALKVSDFRDALEKYARRLEGSARIDAALKEASCLPPIAADAEEFDANDLILPVQNGVIEFQGPRIVFREHRPQDNVTMLANVAYDPQAECPRYDAFIKEIFEGNQDLIDVNNRYYGYCLTGNVSEQILLIPIGQGSNGKSVHLDVITWVLGDYAMISPPDLLTSTHKNSHPTEIMDLRGRRLVVCSEPERGSTLNLPLVKRLTGDAELKGRYMRQDFVSFRRTNKTVLVTNNRPTVQEDSNAVWRRIRLVPYNFTVPEKKVDKHLLDKLKQEGSGILNRLIQGYVNWQKSGLNWPDEVCDATDLYRVEQNPLWGFLEEYTISGEGLAVPVCELHEQFKIWANISGLGKEFSDIDARRFSVLVTDCGVKKGSARVHGKVYKCWTGIGLKNNEVLDESCL